MELLRNFGTTLEYTFVNGTMWLKKRWGIVLACFRCGKSINIGWTNDYTLYCEDCFKEYKKEVG